MPTRFPTVTFFLLVLVANTLGAKDIGYDPLKTSERAIIVTQDFIIKDEKRNREVPVKVYRPNTESPIPLVLFSHGLGGSKDKNPYLGNHWAKRGYIAVFMQYAGIGVERGETTTDDAGYEKSC